MKEENQANAEIAEANRRIEHLNRILKAIRNFNQLIVGEDDPQRLIERACVNLTETMGYLNTRIVLLGGETARRLGLPESEPVAAAAGFDSGFEPLCKRLFHGQFPEYMTQALTSKDVHVVDDPATDCPDSSLSGDSGRRAGLVRRLEYDGVTYGILTVSVPNAYARDDEEQDLFNEVAGDLAFALCKIAAVRRSEERRQYLNFVIEGSGVGTWEWNVQTHETRFNEQWAVMLGYTIEELTPYDYTTWERLVHPQDIEQTRQALAICMEGRTPDYSCEFRMRHKDGRWVWILSRVRVMTRDDAGKALSMFGTHTDITKIKKAEEDLRKEREISKRLIEDGPVGIVKLNRDGEIVFANRHVEELFGLEISDIEGRIYNAPDWRITAVDGAPFPDEELPFRRVMATGQAVADVQHAIVRTDGARRILSINGAPLHDAQRQIEGVVFAILDITEHHAADEALKQELNFSRTLLDSIPTPVFYKDKEGRYQGCNRAFSAVIGVTTEEIHGKTVHELWPSEYSETYHKADLDLMENPEHQVYEFKVKDLNGNIRPVVFAKDVFRDGKGRVAGIVGAFLDISEQKQAEQIITKQRERLNYILEGTKAGTWEWNVQTGEAVFNEEWASIIGYTLEEITPVSIETWIKYTHPEDLEGSNRLLDSHFKGETDSYHYECRMKHKSGEWVWVLDRGKVATWTEDGKPEWMYGTHQDITERKHTEEELRISEDRLSKIMRAANDGMWDWDLKTNNVFFDPRYYEMAGYSIDEFPHRMEAFQERVHPEDIDEVMAQAEKHLKGEIERFQVEFRFRRKSGKWMWIAGRGIIVGRDDEGMPTRFVGTHQDITERKHAIEALKESEKRFKDLVAMLPIAVFETDINMKLTFANLFAFEIFGYSEADLANGINGLDLIAPSDHERVMSNFAQRFKGEDPGTVEYQAITKDGSVFYMLLRAASIVKDGEFHGIRGVIVDITDRKQAEKEKEKLQSQLQQAQKMEAIGTLAGGVAHDFNNLLMGIQGRASLMSFDLESSHPCHEHVNAIMDYSRSASGLTKQLLGVARGGKFEVKPIDLNEILSSSATMFGRTKKEIRIQKKLHNPSPVVMVDRMQIEQVLLNLFVNAWQAMPQSGEIYLETSIVHLDEINCKPHSANPGTYAKISVTDTGIGMDKAILPQIFDPFFSTKEKGRGTGLGLASSYGIVKNHGGIVTVYSEVGHGTTFNIYLPLSDKTAEKEETPTSTLIKGTETILLIDDEQMITEVGQTMLDKLGYRVVVANNGEDGIALMNERGTDIDLVILDMIMPGMDGGQTFDRIREIHSTIPVILSSGYSQNGQAEKIIDRGCSGFIQKPFDLETLSRKVHEVMNQSKSDDQE